MLKIGVVLDEIIEVTHPLVNLIKAIIDSGEGDVSLISDKPLIEGISEYLNIGIEKIYFIENLNHMTLELDIYFSTKAPLIYQIQKKGLLGGHINLECNECQIAFDHRLFLDEISYKATENWLKLIGFLQKQTEVALKLTIITTRQRSIDDSIKKRFKEANCKLDAICFLAIGDKEDIFNFFSPCLYFEGEKKETFPPMTLAKPLLFV